MACECCQAPARRRAEKRCDACSATPLACVHGRQNSLYSFQVNTLWQVRLLMGDTSFWASSTPQAPLSLVHG